MTVSPWGLANILQYIKDYGFFPRSPDRTKDCLHNRHTVSVHPFTYREIKESMCAWSLYVQRTHSSFLFWQHLLKYFPSWTTWFSLTLQLKCHKWQTLMILISLFMPYMHIQEHYIKEMKSSCFLRRKVLFRMLMEK